MNNKIIFLIWLTVFNYIYIYPKYNGQFLQDKFINEFFFHNRLGGVFVDVGAYDGLTDSNTLFLKKN